MKRIDRLKHLVGIILLVLLITIVIYIVLVLKPKNDKSKFLEEKEKIKYGYILYERDTEIYRDVFNELKLELNNDSIDYEKYAEYISKLFIIDLYTLNNKVSKDDVGGIQFVMNDIKDNYLLNVSDTMYKYINEDGIELPEVSSIELLDINSYKYSINNKEYDGYEVNLKWDYKKDLGYDSEGIVYVIKDEDELFVVEKK